MRRGRSLRWTVEHGHANNFANGYTSVAYWYQTEPHAPFPALPARAVVRPPLPAVYDEARHAFFAAVAATLSAWPDQGPLRRIAGIGEHFYAGRFTDTLAALAAR